VASSFGTTNTNPNAERMWFQNPVQTLNPESIRPFSFSQVPSRLAIYEDDAGNLPQQTAGSAGITMDLSSKFSMSTNVNEKYDFDVQQDNTAFVFNMNNTNNMVEVNYATQDLINNNNYITNNFGGGGTSAEPSFGASAVIVSYSNGVWNEPNMVLDFDVQTATYANGLLVSVSTTVHSVTLDALSTLWDWYDDADDFSLVDQVSDVKITGGNSLRKETYDWTFVHGLLQSTPTGYTSTEISPLTDCP
jgi:hypothetical protein